MNPQNNLLITGARGQLGSEFQVLKNYYSEFNFFFVDSSDLDITDATQLESFIKRNQINVLINCAAYTAVDKAEDETSLCFKVNAEALSGISKICNNNNVHLIHYSTYYVFYSKSEIPYKEESEKKPISVYGKSKAEGEDIIIKNSNSYTIIRTSWVYSTFGHNFVKTMIKLGRGKDEIGVVSDQWGSPTYAYDLAQMTLDLLPKIRGHKNILHFSNLGKINWAQFAAKIFELTHINCKVKQIKTSDYPTKAVRPQFSLLDKSKLKKVFNYDIDSWDDALKRCLEKMNL